MNAQGTKYYAKLDDIFKLKSSPQIMGILNITPDSFFDGGRYTVEKNWLEQSSTMLEQGANIIDIGAYSSRPGANNISTQEEETRIIPVIKSVIKHFPAAIISVDTFRAEIAKNAIEEGALIINDISGGTMDDKMFSVVAKHNTPYILTHIQGTPQTMQSEPSYENITTEIKGFFNQNYAILKELGHSKLIVDPGFGFGKTIDHNYELLSKLDEITAINLPVLVGISRKSMIYKLLNSSPQEALNGTSITNTIALLKGAKILRVHDIRQAKEAITIVQQLAIS